MCVCSSGLHVLEKLSLFAFLKELPDVVSQYYSKSFSFPACWRFMFIPCEHVCVRSWASRCLRYRRPCWVMSSIVSRSGTLNSVGPEFERKEDVLRFTYEAGELSTLFSYSSLNFQQLLLFLLLFQPSFVFFMLLKTALSHSHVRGLYGRKTGMVSRCECVLSPWLFKAICVCVVCVCVCVLAGL